MRTPQQGIRRQGWKQCPCTIGRSGLIRPLRPPSRAPARWSAPRAATPLVARALRQQPPGLTDPYLEVPEGGRPLEAHPGIRGGPASPPACHHAGFAHRGPGAWARLARRERADLAEAARSKSVWRVARVASDRLRHMAAKDRERVLELLRVSVDVEGWEQCGECDGRGKLPGRRGGDRCGRRQGCARSPQSTSRACSSTPGDVLAGSRVHFGNNRHAAI